MRALGLWGRGRSSPEAAVAHLVAMQAQEHRYARWSVAQRVAKAVTGTAIDGAFDQGRLLRTHVLRPTWHYVAPADLRWLLGLSGPRVHAGNARRYAELGLDARTLARAADVMAKAVGEHALTRHELGAVLERRGISVDGQRLPYLLMYAELHALICSGPKRDKQHTYAAFDARVPPGGHHVEGEEALAELTRRYFASRGPATADDFAWWSGLGARDAPRGLELVGARLDSRVVDGRRYFFEEGPGVSGATRVDLVQCFDEVIISYRQSRDVLQTGAATFPVPGHVDGFTHVLLRDGRLLGHWRQRRVRSALELETRVGVKLTRDEDTALEDALDRYRRFDQA